jgi:23S rRNA-/tRNA-specific pseudouridylate synthase
MAHEEILVAPDEKGLRIDQLLMKRFPGLSRRSCRELLSRRPVLINGSRAGKGRRVSAGDRLIVDEDEILGSFTDFIPSPSPPAGLKVIHRDADLLAVDKPPGINCAPIRRSDTGTLLSSAVGLEPRLAQVKGWRQREAGLLFRLDRDVSGVVLFALAQEAFDRLAGDSREDLVRKTYLAVVENIRGPRFDRGGAVTVKGPVFGSGRSRVAFDEVFFHPGKTLDQAAARVGKRRRGGRALLRIYTAGVEPLAHHGDLTLLRVEITRAFRHQIRSSLALLGHPVLGDRLYGSAREVEGGGILLHLWKISFSHPGDRRPMVLMSEPERIFEARPVFRPGKKVNL